MYTELTKQAIQAENIKIGDVFSNPEADLGFGTFDPTIQGLYPQARTLTWNLQRIESVMRADPFFTRALEWRATKPLIKGIDISSDEMDADKIEDFQDMIEQKINPSIKEGLYSGDAFGWSALLIVIDGENSTESYKRPLDKNKIGKDKFLGLKQLTRWYEINPDQKMISELGDKNKIYDPRLLGTPEFYNVSFDQNKHNQYKVHRSRLIIIPRNMLAFIEKKVEHYGGTSLLEQSFESLTRYHSLVAQVHRILHKSVIPILKLEGITVSGMQNEASSKALEEKLGSIRRNLSNHNMLVVGEDDDLQFVEATLNNLDKMLQEAKIMISSAHNTPRNILFLEDDDDNQEKYEDFIKERQEFLVKEIYHNLLPILYMSEFGEEMPKYRIKFKSLESPTQKEMAEARKTNVESLKLLYEMGAFDVESIQKTLPDIDNNPQDIFRNLTKEYRKEIESGEIVTYISSQIQLAEALNKMGGDVVEEQVAGRTRGGDPTQTKEETPNTPIKKDKEEG